LIYVAASADLVSFVNGSINVLIEQMNTYTALDTLHVDYIPAFNTWTGMGTIVTATNGGVGIMIGNGGGSNTSECYYNGFMAVDLTDAFGASNEPNLTYCTANLPFFNGSKSGLTK